MCGVLDSPAVIFAVTFYYGHVQFPNSSAGMKTGLRPGKMFFKTNILDLEMRRFWWKVYCKISNTKHISSFNDLLEGYYEVTNAKHVPACTLMAYLSSNVNHQMRNTKRTRHDERETKRGTRSERDKMSAKWNAKHKANVNETWRARNETRNMKRTRHDEHEKTTTLIDLFRYTHTWTQMCVYLDKSLPLGQVMLLICRWIAYQ